MKRDPLQSMLQIRQATLDEAQQAIGNAYKAEQAAASRTHQAALDLDREMAAALSLGGDDEAVESYARWLPIGRRSLKQAQDEQSQAIAELDRMRTMLALARSGVRAVEALIEQRQQEQRLEAGRREQRILDDAGLRRPAH